MANKILFVLFILLSTPTYAQKIELDRIEDDGRRQIMCSGKKEKLDGREYSFTIKAYKRFEYIDWCLLISSFNYIPNNAVLLIKLGNGDVLTIPINNLHIGDVTMPSYSYRVGRVAYSTLLETADYYSAIFVPTEDQFTDMEQYGIVKVRISSRSSYNEKSWGKDKLGKYFAKCRNKISERLKTTTVKSIYDDF